MLYAEEVCFVQILNQESVVWRVHHFREHEQAFKVCFSDLLFDEFVINDSRDIDQVWWEDVYVQENFVLCDEERSCHTRP